MLAFSKAALGWLWLFGKLRSLVFPTSASIGFGFVNVSKLRVSNVGPTCLGVSVPLGLGVSIASLGWL